MPSTYTSRNRFTLQGSGENESTWGDIVNTVLELADDSLDGILDLDITLGNETLTALNGIDDESRNRVLNITNAHTAERQVIIPDVEKWYLVEIQNSNGATTTIRNSSDITGVSITDTSWKGIVKCDGTVTEIFFGPEDLSTFLVAANNLSDLDDAETARTNLSVYSKEEIQTGLTPAVSIGDVKATACLTAPDYWVFCRGQALNRVTYADLFAEIGITFGAGDGTTTFNVPDLQGEFVRGFDAAGSKDPGRVFGSVQADELKSHAHASRSATSTGGGTPAYILGPFASTTAAGTIIQNTGGSETRPKNVALNYVIFTGVL